MLSATVNDEPQAQTSLSLPEPTDSDIQQVRIAAYSLPQLNAQLHMERTSTVRDLSDLVRKLEEVFEILKIGKDTSTSSS